MKICRTIREMRACVEGYRRAGMRVGFVPTMGYLHEGHLSLVRAARARSDRVVVSVFVNPTQFAPGEDYAAYPRDFQRDEGLCAAEGVDAVFYPEAAEMYPSDCCVYVDETRLTRGLCGAVRPGHFRGVVTVVAKLFNIVTPDVAVFGQKDIQQARVIEKLVEDLNFPLEMVIAPTQREPSGLAMSSRNVYLAAGERERAASLYQALQRAEEDVRNGATDAAAVIASMRMIVESSRPTAVDYIEIVDYATLAGVSAIQGKCVAALAVRYGRTRLIDNAILVPPVKD